MNPTELFIIAGSPDAAPEVRPGATVCATPAAIERFRQIALLSSLELQAKGIKTHRGPSALSIARSQYGIKARTASSAAFELREKMIRYGVIVPR